MSTSRFTATGLRRGPFAKWSSLRWGERCAQRRAKSAVRVERASRAPRWAAVYRLAWGACLAALLLGCRAGPAPLNSIYGQRRGAGAASVNGTAALAELFAASGHQVTSRGQRTARLDDAEVIVWAPDNFTPPAENERAEIENWLAAAPGRTLVYIGRDYDAAVEYWQAAARQTPVKSAAHIQRQLALARSAHDAARAAMPASRNAKWFQAERDHPRLRAAELFGPWAAGIQGPQADIPLQGRYYIPTHAATDDRAPPVQPDDLQYVHQVLLGAVTRGDAAGRAADGANVPPADDPFDEAGGFRQGKIQPLVMRVTHPRFRGSQVIVVTNGSFLLNLPLVRHERRKLAGRLVAECGGPAKVVFWEGPAFASAAGREQPDEWSFLAAWPINFILLHLAVLGMLYMLWRFPIFGPQRTLPPASTSDFGRHIDALGDLLASTRDTRDARERLAAYQELVKRE